MSADRSSAPFFYPPPKEQEGLRSGAPEDWETKNLVDVRFIILDTETTGVEDDAKIIEVAVREWFLSDRGVLSARPPLELLVNPGIKIAPASSAVHHLTDETVRHAPALEEVMPMVLDYVGDSPLVAYNSDYDRGKFEGTPLYDHLWVDAYRMAMHFWHLGQKNRNGFALTSLKQQELRYWLELPPIEGDAHRAGADILLTGLLFQEMVKKYTQMGCSTRFSDFLSWVNAPILHRTIPIGGRPYQGKTPEEVETWALKKAFEKNEPMYESFKKFNVHDALGPEFARRLGKSHLTSSPARRSPTKPR